MPLVLSNEALVVSFTIREKSSHHAKTYVIEVYSARINTLIHTIQVLIGIK